MAPRLGATFLRCAMGPVSYAGQCIMSARVADGLRELAPEGLTGGFERGISEVAARSGLRKRDVEKLLPIPDVRYTAMRLQSTQMRAAAAWQAHAGHVGGLLTGIAELTADGRVPDVGECLLRLAAKVSRDSALAQPLRELATDVARWQELLEHCRELLESGSVVRAYQRRRALQLGVLGGATLIIAVCMSMVAWVAVGRAHVDRALAAADDCAVEALDPEYRGRASGAQRAALDAKHNACRDRKLAEERAVFEERLRREQAEQRESATRAHEDQCARLADDVEAGSLTDGDTAIAGEALALLGRTARKTLDVGDLGPADVVLPCQDSAAGARLRAAFAAAVLAQPAAWANADDLSPLVSSLLVERRGELADVRVQRFGGNAEERARGALMVGDAARMERATRLCKLKQGLGIEVKSNSSCGRLLEGPPPG